MKNIRVFRTVAALTTLAAAASSHAYAIEPGSADPHEPGISNGIPAGALPPPGFYFTNDLSYIDGSLNNGNGDTIKGPVATNITAYVDVPVLLWSSPFHFLGAQYAAAFVQPIVTVSATNGSHTVNKTGLFNPVLVPAILSWQLPYGFFVSGNFAVYLPVGDTGDRGNGTGRNTHIANNTTTFAPGGAISWFNGKGLEASLNLEYDIQTENTNFATLPAIGVNEKFQSGDVLNLDFTVQQAFGKWTVGPVGYFVVQTSDDQTTTTLAGVGSETATFTVPGVTGTGNKFEKFALGPSVSYNFGPITLNARYTRDLYAKNATQNDVFWFRFSLPL